MDPLAFCLRLLCGRAFAARRSCIFGRLAGDKNCVFCNLLASVDYAIDNGMDRNEAEAAGGLIKRGEHCFICLNAFPYTSGHVMVLPYAHLDRVAACRQPPLMK